MERHVKERLIGAAVLMAAAVILIPEMLSGPERATVVREEAAAPDASLKTYTIDLQQQATNTPAAVEERAPPPEEPATTEEPAPSPQENPEPGEAASASTAAVGATSPAPTQAAPSAARSPPLTEADRSTSPPVRATAGEGSPQRPALPAPPRDAGRWAVQVGSFSKQETAERLAAELQADGHKAFVMPVRTSNSTLYRVRVGPMAEREAAVAASAALKSRASGATIVAHP